MLKPILVVLLLLPLAALAQQEERLPDLTPQEFEIRGDLQVSLPDLERQPLRGFAPPPRAYVVPADRQPFVAPYAQRLDDLPDYPLHPSAPPSLTGATPRTGQVDLMAGSYFGRRARLTLNAGGFGLDAAYTGYSGFDPLARVEFDPMVFALDEYQADSDNFRGTIRYATGDSFRLGLAADAAYNEYWIWQSERRRLENFGVEAVVEGPTGEGTSVLTARLESNRVIDPSRHQGQKELLGRGGAALDFGAIRFAGDVWISTLDYVFTGDPPDWSEGRSPVTSTAYSAEFSFVLPIAAGALRVGAAAVQFAPSSDWRPVFGRTGRNGGLYAGPVIDFELPLTPSLTFSAKTRPEIEYRSQADLFRANPYIQRILTVAPDVHLVNAEAGLRTQAAWMLARIYAGYRRSPNQLYFGRLTSFEEPVLFNPQFEPTSLVRTGGELTFYGPGEASLSGGIEFRRARLIERHMAVPHVAPLSWSLSLTVPFSSRGLLQGVLHGEGERPDPPLAFAPDGLEHRTAPAWMGLALEAHYRFAGRFGLVARLDHGAERWPGFPQPPMMITAGLRAGW